MTQLAGLERSERQAPHRARNLIAVASGKGGVGKTWLAVTLSHALARSGQRVLLFDGDLGLANVDVQLGLDPQHDLGGVLAGRLRLREAVQAHADGGFDIIAGRSGSGGLAGLAPRQLGGLTGELMALASAYDRVILDLGAGVDRTVRHLASQAATTFVVSTDEPTSLTDAYAFIKLTLKHDPGADVRVVVNLAASRHDGERTHATLRKACENFLSASPALAGVVRRDPRVKESIRHQAPLLLRHPGCPAADDVEALATRLLESA